MKTQYYHFFYILFFSFINLSTHYDWGFYAHKQINYLATFTLPEPLFGFYKEHIHFIKNEAIAPDQRRRMLPNEDIKHYIDIDHWEKELPLDTLPKDLWEAVYKHSVWETTIQKEKVIDSFPFAQIQEIFEVDSSELSNQFRKAFYKHSDYHNFEIQDSFFLSNQKFQIIDNFSTYGIAPYNIEQSIHLLTKAFVEKDVYKIIKRSADLGHYLADIHVPLHTTSNYNGQLTNQKGIHSLWETQVPELFFENYNLFTGQASYSNDIKELVWQTVTESHQLVNKTLAAEMLTKAELKPEHIKCFEDRKNRTIWKYCDKFVEKYNSNINNAPEERLKDAIQTIGSIWLTCWVNAGQPDPKTFQKNSLENMNEIEFKKYELITTGSHSRS